MSKHASEIASALRSNDSFLLSVHINPDGDALGSQLALLFALRKIGKRVAAHNLDPVPETYRFLPGAGEITSGGTLPSGPFDALVVLDAEPSRTGLFDGNYPARTLINIDHHVTNPLIWPLTWLDTNASATGEMVYHLIRELGVAIERDIALCLYTSIFTDTGSFRYTNTTPAAMRIAAELIASGADPWQVTENVYESFTMGRLKLLGHVLAAMERSADGMIAWVIITDELYRITGTTAEDTDNLINFVRSVKGVEVAVLFRQTGPREYKLSLRSKGRVDVSGIAKSLGGGGHANASGCVMEGTIEEVRTLLIQKVSDAIREHLTGR